VLYHTTVHQQIAYDDVNGPMFVSQMMHSGVQLADEPGPLSSSVRRLQGDMVINRLNPATGALTGWMICRGMGHGSFGVEPVGSDTYIWAEADSVSDGTTGYGCKIARFKFVDQAVVDSGDESMEMFDPLPNTAHIMPVVDCSTRRIGARWTDPADGNHPSFGTFDMDAMREGDYTLLSQTRQSTSETGGLPGGAFQSHALFGPYHYVLTGSAYGTSNPAPGNTYITAIRIEDSSRADVVLVTAGSALEYREPEGLTVRYTAQGPQLVLAFGTKIPTPHPMAVYSWDNQFSPSAVPGQVSAGLIDGLFRANPDDGTLGLPDYSRVPYAYAPLLGPKDSSPQWALDQWRNGAYGALKGSSDGYGALRSVGGTRGAASIDVLPMSTGVPTNSPDGSRDADYTWAPKDFAFALRHPGTAPWTAASTRAYVAFCQNNNTVGMRLTTPAALGPWDAETADSAAVSLNGLINVWDGNSHNFTVGTFGQNAFVIIDEALAVPFRAPRSYQRNALGLPNPGVFSNLPTTGNFVGFDTRGTENFMYGWTALQQPSGDFFYYDMGALEVQTPPSGTYTPTKTPSGETWSLTGAVTASKNGLAIPVNGWATFNVAWPYGVLGTRWISPSGGLVFRAVDTNNYYQVTTNGMYVSINGNLTKIHTWATQLKVGDHIAIRNWADRFKVFINGVQSAYYTASYYQSGRGIGFHSGPEGATQWSYIVFQPLPSSITLPTA
jgi:hypothetical protein